MSKPQVVFAAYKPNAGKGKELDALVAKHFPLLVDLNLVTSRKPIIVRAKDGTVIEVFEWKSAEAAGEAHEHPALAKIWEAMAKIATFPGLAGLAEIKDRFAHFEPLE